MEIEVKVKFDEGEMSEVKDVFDAIDEVITVPIEQLELEPIDEAVLRAVRENPGRAARKVHQNAAEYDDCPIDWVAENSPEREAVKNSLHKLLDDGLVELRERSWYPAN
jgi:hypothetical protein